MRRVLALTAALLTTAVVAMPAAAAERPAIEILSPQRGADHVSTSRPMRVRIRVAPGVRKLHAIAAGKKHRVVTRRLHRRRRGIWTGTLRIGRELDRGPGALTVDGRRRGQRVAASVHFYVMSRRAEMLTVRGLPRQTSARPLNVRLKATKRVDNVRVRVNGRGARDAFTSTVGGTWRGVLSASHGLRFGRNRVVITAYDRAGAFERVKRIVEVRRGRPLAGAGKDRLIREREQVRLDGRSTLPRTAERLRLTWRIVGRPKGSTARLRNIHAVRPLLRPDRPGIYRIRLTAGPRRAAGTASAADAPSADTVNVSVQPAETPKGIPVQTIGANDGQASGPGVKIGDTWYSMDADKRKALQMVVVDGPTTKNGTNRSYFGNDAGIAQLQSDLSQVDQTSVVVLQHPVTRFMQFSGAGQKVLTQVLADLGVEPDDSTGRWLPTSGAFPVDGWSVISSTDGRAANALIGLKESLDRPVGEMDGFLTASAGAAAGQIGATHVFRWPDTFNTFDTQSAGDNGTYNEMTIAGQTYRSDTITPGSSAFHLVWLDGGTLTLRGQATIPSDQGKQLAQTLAGIDSDPSARSNPALLFMTTIGHPSIPRPSDGAANGWAQAAQEVASFGGNASAFLSLNGSGNAGYSLVGASSSGNYAPNTGEDVSTILETDVATPRLMGLLERRPAGAWTVSTGGAAGGSTDVTALVPDINRVLAQPDQPFQPFTGAERAAEQYIETQLELCAPGSTPSRCIDDPTYGIRANYWDPKQDSRWPLLRKNLTDVNFVPPCTESPCKDAFAAVQKQLDLEFEAVESVRNYFGNYSVGTLFDAVNDEFESGTYTFPKVYNDILKLYTPPKPDAETSFASPFDVVEGMLDVGAELAPFIDPVGGEGVAVALAVAGASIEIGGAFADPLLDSFNQDQDQDLGATVFEAQVSQLASLLQDKFHKSLDGLNRIADLLVSDAGRLQEAANQLNYNWEVNSGDVDATLDRSIEAYMWRALLPTTLKAYQCVVPPVYFPPEDFRPAPWYVGKMKTDAAMQYRPFSTVTHHPLKADPWGYVPKTQGSWIGGGGGSNTINDGFVTVGRYHDGTHEYLDSSQAAKIFGPLDAAVEENLGQLPAYFLAPKPSNDAPGFEIVQGSINDHYDDNNEVDYITYTCAGNWWNEDTNIGGD
jgi:hypothetical protein